MMRRMVRSRVLLLALVVGAFFLSGSECTPEDQQMIEDFANEWANTKFNPVKEDGIDVGALINAGVTLAGGKTGDPETDAIVDAHKTVEKMKTADDLVDKGLKNKNLSSIDEGIALRPEDFTYHSRRGAVQLQTNPGAAAQDFDRADQLAQSQGKRAQEYNLRDRMDNLLIPQSQSGSSNPAIANQLCKDAQQYLTLTGDNRYISRGCKP